MVEIHDEKERQAVADEVLFRFFDIGRDRRVAFPERRLSESEIIRLKGAANRLNRGMPVQYITGVSDFMDYVINVRPGVLIPRPETEELVFWMLPVLNEMQASGKEHLEILDIGTGSGCIAIALAGKYPDEKVFASDISKQSLEIAKYNALYNNILVDFVEDDILSGCNDLFPDSSLDCVVSNPPYVLVSEKAEMAANVLEHEPADALFVPDDDPLLYYRKIAAKSHKWLQNDGYLFFEINEKFAEKCRDMILSVGFSEVIIKKDIHGKDRFIKARR